MTSRITYIPETHWPPLAWLAKCGHGSGEIAVHHGPGVETKEDWFCEAVWDGDFAAGDFDRTDLVFGTGGRVRHGALTFVSSGATVDRLQFLQQGNVTLVSNSLACLKAFSSGWPDIGFSEFRKFFYSIGEGIDQYARVVPSNGPTLVYFHNLSWDTRNLSFAEKPAPERHFESFDSYLNFISNSLGRIGSNLSSSERAYKLSPLGTVSSGYDSATASALARAAGLSEVISFSTAREGLDDSGREIAEHLGLRVHMFDRLAWRSTPLIEAPFIAADAEGGELLFAAAGEELRGKVLITGNHGDKVWATDAKVPLTREIVGGGASGLSLTEYRLQHGFLHLPVPYIGVRSIRDIVSVSNSPEMAPWDIGGDYNRPICRRILEEAGVPRHLFGMKKKAAATLFRYGDVCLTYPTRSQFHRWCRAHAGELAGPGSDGAVDIPLLARWRIPEAWFYGEAFLRGLTRLFPERINEAINWRLIQLRFRLNGRVNALVERAFPWALEVLAERYGPTREA